MDKIDQVIQKQEEIALSQQRIELALFGDDKDPTSGVITKINNHDSDIRRGKFALFFMGGAIIGWPAVWEMIKTYFRF